jgi:hypothetical protein
VNELRCILLDAKLTEWLYPGERQTQKDHETDVIIFGTLFCDYLNVVLYGHEQGSINRG